MDGFRAALLWETCEKEHLDVSVGAAVSPVLFQLNSYQLFQDDICRWTGEKSQVKMTGSGAHERGSLELAEDVRETQVVDSGSCVLKGSRCALVAEAEGRKTADEQELKRSSARYEESKPLAGKSLNVSATSHDSIPEADTAGHPSGFISQAAIPTSPSAYAPVVCSGQKAEKVCRGAAEWNDPRRETVEAVAPAAASQEVTIQENTAETSLEPKSTSQGEGDMEERKERPFNEKNHLKPQKSNPQHPQCHKAMDGVEETVTTTVVPEISRVCSGETEGEEVTQEATSDEMMPDPLLTTCGEAMVEGKGHKARESPEERLRGVLCELDRQALECVQQRMQRSVCFLLETQKEKEAERLALLHERRVLDAMLADTQKQHIQYSTGTVGCNRETITVSSLVNPGNLSVPAKCGSVEPLALPTGVSGHTARRPRPQTQGPKSHVVPQSDLAAEKCKVTSVSPKCAHREEIDCADSLSGSAEEESYETMVADFLGDLLHKYGPAAVKGVGAAAHIVKEGLGVLRQELRDLQKHQQATERQRAMEKQARYMLRRQEELERLRHRHLMQQLQYYHLSSGRNSTLPGLPCSNKGTIAAPAGSADAGKVPVPLFLPATTGASGAGQEISQPDEGTIISSVVASPATRSMSRRASNETAATEDGERSSSPDEKLPREPGIFTTGAKRPAHEFVSKAHASGGLSPSAEKSPCSTKDSISQDDQLHKNANVAVPSVQRLTYFPGVAIRRGTPDPATAAHLSRANHVDTCPNASAEAAAFMGWKEFFMVQGKSIPPPHLFTTHGEEPGKGNSETKIFTNCNSSGGTNARNCVPSDGQNGGPQSGILSSRYPGYTCVRAAPPVSSGLPSSYRTLGTRKERLQRTAASLDSLSRGVADAVGSVKHTIARWFSTSGELLADSEKGPLTRRNTISYTSEADDSSTPSYLTDGNSFRMRPTATNAPGTEPHAEIRFTALLEGNAAVESTTVADTSRQKSQQTSVGDPGLSSTEKGIFHTQGTVTSSLAVDGPSHSQATTRNSSVFGCTAHPADASVTDAEMDTRGETVSAATKSERSTQAGVGGNCVGDGAQSQSEMGRPEGCTRPPVQEHSSAADKGSEDEVRTTSKPLLLGKELGAASRAICKASSIVGQETDRCSVVADNAVPSHNSSSSPHALANSRAKADLLLFTEGGEAGRVQDRASGYTQERANERDRLANEEDPSVIEASIRIVGKNGIVALPLVVLATEQCRDVAEEWVDKHWVLLQQTHLWLMRGKSAVSEAAAEMGPGGASASDGGPCCSDEAGKRSNDLQSGEVADDKGLAGRHICGSSAAKTTFLTRSRAIHSLTAFLGHAEANSESLPVRVAEDWDKIITSPSAETRHGSRQHIRQKYTSGFLGTP